MQKSLFHCYEVIVQPYKLNPSNHITPSPICTSECLYIKSNAESNQHYMVTIKHFNFDTSLKACSLVNTLTTDTEYLYHGVLNSSYTRAVDVFNGVEIRNVGVNGEQDNDSIVVVVKATEEDKINIVWNVFNGSWVATKINAVGGKAKKHRKGSYESMTVAELVGKCRQRKIKYSGLRKAELIAALRR